MWKDFFYYSKSERRAVWILLFLIVLLLSIHILVQDDSESIVEGKILKDSAIWVNSPVESKKYVHFDHSGKTDMILEDNFCLKPFDPNLADSIELSRLGLSSYVIRNILKYREKGGHFTSAESLSRIYGLTEEKWLELKPYVRISRQEHKRKGTLNRRKENIRIDSLRGMKYPEGTLIDVNVADTSELKKIPGIGSGIAKAIVAYRNRLGGFYDLKQLREISYVTSDLCKWFKLENVAVQKININDVSLEELRKHPYLNFYQARIIVDFRRKKGPIKSLSQLALYEEFTEKDLERLSFYLSFD